MFKTRFYWPAILVSAVASFAFEAVWFTVFLQPWLTGIGRTSDWLMHNASAVPALQYATAFVSAGIAATVLSFLIQRTGAQTWMRGVKLGALVWLGFVATSWATEYVFEVKTLAIFGINAGYWLFDLMIMGAIVGGWKGKRFL